MSLDLTKLEKLREVGNGGCQAQCPACAETGQDRTGEHLRVSPDGKFGCCVYPGDRKHRSRIFALAGDSGPKTIKVMVASVKTAPGVQLDLSAFSKATAENLGRLGRVFSSPTERQDSTTRNLGTLGTGTLSLRVGEKKEEDQLSVHKLIDNRQPVPSVPTVEPRLELETGVPSVPTVQLPYLTGSGDLVIPFNSPERYHWWKGKGQSIRRTLGELRERKENEDAPF